MKRCEWCLSNDTQIEYHDKEWGNPCYDDKVHFEFLVLESAQAGLSWNTILMKRNNYRIAYDNFDVNKVKKYDEDKVNELVNNAGIVRNRKKIEASINNAILFCDIQKEFGSFSNYLWSFVDNKPIINSWKTMEELPAKTELSDRVSKELKKRGFKFLGSTTIYAHLQAVGIINDHTIDCFRYKEVQKNTKNI